MTRLLLCFLPVAAFAQVDLTRATVIVSASASSPERKAADMLIDEVERRTGLRWSKGGAGGPAITIAVKPGGPAEGFRNVLTGTNVTISGNDARGALFGTGHLLRNLDMRRGSVGLRADYSAETAPETRLRGHQLGYRPKPNSYDGWTLAMWEQYIRDLVIFGANAVELIPPRSDDDPHSPHFPKPQMEMMIGMARLLDEYGLDVWVWYPAMDDDYSDPKTVEFALREWGEVFRKLPRVDAVLVPAGDPGHTPAPVLLPFLEKQTANLRKHHPKAQMWLAPQGFDAKSMDFFFDAMAKRPAWLSGITYGPQTRISLPELRKRLPREIPVRHYPDITHTRQSQYPVPEWDAVWGLTSSREPINPRPVDQASIFRTQQPHTMGFITYSEGCNDDVNKALWSAMGWQSSVAPVDVLRDYARYFIGPDFTDDFAQGLFALERNWRGPALTNSGVETTLRQFQSMERRAGPAQMLNWRFQQALYRAYYDAYVRRRLLQETAAEDRALAALRRSPALGSDAAMDEAVRILGADMLDREAVDLRTRVFQLAEALYQSIRMQLSVERYGGLSGRGNTLDTVDMPLNSRNWLLDQFSRIRRLEAEKQRVTELLRIANWTDPGPGGFYDDLGNVSRQPHLVPGAGFKDDPQFFHTPLAFFDPRGRGPRSWWDQIITFYEHPLELRYEALDPHAAYRVRVVYGAGPVRLEAEGQELHTRVRRTAGGDPRRTSHLAMEPAARRGRSGAGLSGRRSLADEALISARLRGPRASPACPAPRRSTGRRQQ
jgi:hypothetical protein